MSDRLVNWCASTLAAAFVALYAVFSLGLHASFQTHGFDLGIFEQAVRDYANGKLPVSTIRDPNLVLLGDHFSPVIALLAPFYRAFPSAETLLVAQALLLGVSVLPVTRAAIRLLSPATGIAIGTCYGLSWGLQTALAFDFHEIAFAVPALAFALEALVLGRPRRAVAIASTLVLVKEDLGLTVAALGLLVASAPATRRLGVATAIFGLAASTVAVFVVIPWFGVDGGYRYLGVGGLRPTGDAFRGELLDPGKPQLLALVLAPTLFLALRSRLVLLAVPTLAWRLSGTNVLYWLPEFHYDAMLMPIVFFALVHALTLLLPPRPLPAIAVAAALLVTCVVIGAHFRLREVVRPGFGAPTAFAASARALIQRIPDGASVATENEIAPHLTSRTDEVYLVGTGRQVEWTLARREYLPPAGTTARMVAVDGPLVLLRHDRVAT